MGDMADMANDCAMDDVIELHEHRDAGFPTNQDAYDRGLINELGGDNFSDADYSIPFIRHSGTKIGRSISGPGDCPRCKSRTHLVDGKNGKFWGCDDFPKCKGSRNF